MYNFFGIISGISFLATAFFVVAWILGKIRNKPSNSAKKAGIALLIWLISSVGMGLTNTQNQSAAPSAKHGQGQEQENTSTTRQEKTENSAGRKKIDGIIGKSPGIGDLAAEFEKEHKISHDNGLTKTYDNDHFNAVIVDGRIINLTITANEGHKMDAIISSLVPSDGTEISVNVDNSDPLISKHISIGHSDMLGNTIPSSNGHYTRIDLYDTPTGNYLYTVLDVGD